jgi:hypothetical protein
MIAVDFSQFSKNITDHAGRLAEDLGAELFFVNVINQRDVNMVEMVTAYTDKLSVEGYVNDLKEMRTAEMQKILQKTNCTQIPTFSNFFSPHFFLDPKSAIQNPKSNLPPLLYHLPHYLIYSA